MKTDRADLAGIDLFDLANMPPVSIDLPRLLAGAAARAGLGDAADALAGVARGVGSAGDIALDDQYQTPDWQRSRGARDGRLDLING